MNGRVLAEQLGALRPDTKVLFTSGYAEDVIAHHGVREPGIQFLAKPYTVQTLAGKIREVLEQT
jgi:FixJ family two-component response regulator